MRTTSEGCFNIVVQCIIRHQVQREDEEVPVAVVVEELHKEELKTLLGATVTIREMTYGERLKRSGLMGAMRILKDTKSDYAGEIAMQSEKLALWDFANLIVDHNLQDKDERLLNFKDPVDVEKLSASVGEEVGSLIDKWNTFDDAGN
jgi:hypothetical protein